MATEQKKPANDQLAVVAKNSKGKNSINDDEARCVREAILRWAKENCSKPDGSLKSERAIAKAIGVSSNEYTRWMKDKARPGAPRLIYLAKKLNISVGALLGYELPLPTQQRQAQLDQIVRLVDEFLGMLSEAGIQPTPASKLGKKLEEIRSAKLRAVHQRILDERERKVAAG